MALPEVVPTLVGIRDLLTRLHESVKHVDEDPALRASNRTVALDYDGALGRIAKEIDGQVRTATRRFTVAVVGEFKVGKSTLLNGLLGLRGEAALPVDEAPQTACAILIRDREAGAPEARLRLQGGAPQDVSWSRARQLTSQTWLEDHADDRKLAQQLLEVEYLVRRPLLAQLNLCDLPGTGSRYWREHTQLTHARMKEADAVLWVVGEEEPSADARRDLAILADCSQVVLPIVNALEDPTKQIPRNPEVVEQIVDVLKSEFGSFFARGMAEPLVVSARVVELELAKDTPSQSVLEAAGYVALVRTIEGMLQGDNQRHARVRRLCGAAAHLLSEANGTIGQLRARIASGATAFEADVQAREAKLDEIDDVHQELRDGIRQLAKERAATVCRTVGEHATLFVGDVLQISNFRDLASAISKEGRAQFEANLQRRFLRDYLQMETADNWLVKLSHDYAEDVRAVVVPRWRRLVRERLPQLEQSGLGEVPMLQFEQLGAALVQGINQVILRVLGILGVAGLLAVIPGGQVIDAIGIVGLLVVSAITDPLAGARRRAVSRVRLQVESQQYEVGSRLLDAGMEGNKVVEDRVRQALTTALATSRGEKERLDQLAQALRDAEDDLGKALAALQEMGREAA